MAQTLKISYLKLITTKYFQNRPVSDTRTLQDSNELLLSNILWLPHSITVTSLNWWLYHQDLCPKRRVPRYLLDVPFLSNSQPAARESLNRHPDIPFFAWELSRAASVCSSNQSFTANKLWSQFFCLFTLFTVQYLYSAQQIHSPVVKSQLSPTVRTLNTSTFFFFCKDIT